MKRSVVLVILLILCVVFCACGKDTTANKTPSVSQTPEQQNTLPTFTKESTESIHDGLGNSIANYSSISCLLAECKDYIFHSYNADHQIIMVEKTTNNSTPLPIYGTDLSIYNNILYYIPSDRTSFCSYNLLSGESSTVTFLDNLPNGFFYEQVFVLDFGFVVRYTDEWHKTQMIRCIDFDGDIIAEKKPQIASCILSGSSSMAARSGDNIILFSLPNLSESFSAFPYSIAMLSTSSDENIYSYMYNKPFINKLRKETNAVEQWDVPFGDILSAQEYSNRLYCTTDDGVFVVSPSNPAEFFKFCSFKLTDLTFTTNGYIYAFVSTSGEDYIDHIKGYHISLKFDGSDMTVLSN